MAWETALVHRFKTANRVKEIHSFTATGVTSGTIVTGLNNIESAILSDYTGIRASAAIVITNGSVAISGVTASDAGTLEVIGR